MKIPRAVMERRRSVRIAEKLPFKIGHGEFVTEAVTVNISFCGALCLVRENFPIMTQLKIALSLPDGRKNSRRAKVLLMKGVVVRKEKALADNHFLIAVYFSDIRPVDRQYLQKFIENRSSAAA